MTGSDMRVLNYAEMALVSQQLAARLRAAIGLEMALDQLCEEMPGGGLRRELGGLAADLKNGATLASAMGRTGFPEFFRQVVAVGVKSGRLPEAFTVAAAYYQKQDDVWRQIKVRLLYPALVLAMVSVVCGLSWVSWHFYWRPLVADCFGATAYRRPAVDGVAAMVVLDHAWMLAVLLGLLFAALVAVAFKPLLWRRLGWRWPVLRETNVARISAMLQLLLEGGVPLAEAIETVAASEPSARIRGELSKWRKNLAEGATTFLKMVDGSSPFPPAFIWIVNSYEEGLTAGFGRAAIVFERRALEKTRRLLGAIMPFATIVLGIVILAQCILVVTVLVRHLLMG